MPPFLIVVVGAIGAVALAKLISAESRRINQALDRHRKADTGEIEAVPLERDPATGDYRPKRG